MTITIGSWIFPLIISAGLFFLVLDLVAVTYDRYSEEDVTLALIATTPISLAVWLIWALIMWWLS